MNSTEDDDFDPDDGDESDWPDTADLDGDLSDEHGDGPTCPHCGKSIYEDAERCPRCGLYISDEEGSPNRKPMWIVIGVAVCLVAVLIVWMMRF